MTSTRKMLLGTAAATIAVTAGVDTGAQAADVMLKKAPPIQYVRICDRYGYGFFQIPGSSICLQLRGQIQSDNDYQPTHDLLFMQASKGTGAYSQNFIAASQQDKWGYEVTAKPRFDARTETSMGTFRAYVELKLQLDAGAFRGPGPANGGEVGAGNKVELYRGYMQWAGWTIGETDSIFSNGSFKDGDIADVLQADKQSGWSVYYTWTPTGPGVPPVKGSAPVPDGWSFSFGADSPVKGTATTQFTAPNPVYPDVVIAGANAVGSGSVAASYGPLTIPDFVARLHYEADPPGTDDQHNSQFGVGTFHLAGIYHQITMLGLGSAGSAVPIVPVLPAGVTAVAGPAVTDHGYAVGTFAKFFVPMWPGTKLGANRSSNADNIQLAADYCDGAVLFCGLGGSNGNLMAGDAYWTGGLVREDTDGRTVNNGAGSFFIDKEKAFTVNAQYHSILTDCTDPVHCLAFTLEGNYVWVTPGSITQNVDWTQGGLGKARKGDVSAEISWGTSRNGTTRPVFWRVDFEVQYLKIWQDLPSNCNGIAGCAVAATPLPLGIAQNPSSWVWRTTLTFDW
jgi:hypothetical protein